MRQEVFATAFAILISSPGFAQEIGHKAEGNPEPRDPYCDYWPAYCSPSNAKTDWERELEGAEFSEDLIVGYQIALSPDDEAESSASMDSDKYVVGNQVAQAAPDGDASAFSNVDEMARKSSNPLGGDFWILLNQFDNYFYQGDITDDTRNINTWALQPVIPIGLGGDWIVVNRPTFPFILNADLPDSSGFPPGGPPTPPPSGPPPGGVPFSSESGFGDIVHFSLVGQSISTEDYGGGDWVWGVGPTFQFPTASQDELGSGKYSAGPAAVGAFIGKDFILGALSQNWISYASEDSGREDVEYSWLNLFYFLNFEDGWQVGGTPVITADWEADSDNRWSVPIGLGVYKTHLFGKMPIKIGIEPQYYAVQPDAYGPEWNIRVTIAPIIPALF